MKTTKIWHNLHSQILSPRCVEGSPSGCENPQTRIHVAASLFGGGGHHEKVQTQALGRPVRCVFQGGAHPHCAGVHEQRRPSGVSAHGARQESHDERSGLHIRTGEINVKFDISSSITTIITLDCRWIRIFRETQPHT
jgi:hypothetical protein